MPKVVQVMSAAAAAEYKAANPDIVRCFYLQPANGGILDPKRVGFENTGSPPEQVFV
jgi:hypothetical protein